MNRKLFLIHFLVFSDSLGNFHANLKLKDPSVLASPVLGSQAYDAMPS